ncbi:DUF4179 domain-containing protein [Paenibacillus macerans]|uniref:DUF4179 domain-containing protein n=1 Tax=Paenibacillus macerans TaxID=44252 RepID=UPI0022E2F3BB|nr:DUF4179 domain-containing protein [Paenibacillus macerans]MEC0135737.1 DUF4179 domain-containing protein [Paenibacillus macerans]
MKNIYKVMTTAALMGMLVGGTAWGTVEAAGSAKAKAPAVSSAAQASTAKADSVTQNGITLTVSKALYDGNYVSLTLQRSGKGYTGGITDGKFNEATKEYERPKGAIKNIEMFIDGKSIYEFGGGGLGKRPALGWGPASAPDTAEIQLVDPSWLGSDGMASPAFPDKFKLTAKVTLEGVDKPYTFDFSLQKNADNLQALKPNLTKKRGDYSATLSKLNVTSTSTRFQLIEKGLKKGEHSRILYEVVDDQGNLLDLKSGFGTDENNKNGDKYNDYVFSPPEKDAKSITIRAFEPDFVPDNPNDPSSPGIFKTDSNGELIKNYIKELEMTVNIK